MILGGARLANVQPTLDRITRFPVGCWGYLAIAFMGCGGDATSSSPSNATSATADATSAQPVTTTGEPLTTTGEPADGATTAGGRDTANSSAAAPTVGTTASGGSGGANGETTANSSGVGGDAALGCPGYCDPCPEGQRRYACESACLCDLEDDRVRDEHERLLACSWERPCLPADLPAEIFFSANAGDFIYLFSGMECLFAALRDRTPGRFDFVFDGHTGFSLAYAAYSFLLDGSDNVLSLQWNYSSVPPSGTNDQRVFAEVESCTLRDPSVFDGCLDDPETCADANPADTTSKWFDDCVPVHEPTCASP